MRINDQHVSGFLNCYSIGFANSNRLYNLAGEYYQEEAAGVSKRTALANENQALKIYPLM